MRTLAAIAACSLLAQGGWAESYTVRVQETAIVEIAGATAAYTTNPDIADVAIPSAGRVAVTGHSSGTTQLVVITASGTQTFLITVATPAHAPAAPEAGASRARYEGRYSSGTARLQNAVDVTTHDGDRQSDFHVLHIHDLRTFPGESSDVLASIFYRNSAPGRVWTLLDDMVDVSRTTISNTQVRGLHLTAGALELHGGFASSALYDGLFLPTDRRWVAGGGYGIDRGGIRWTPSVYAFFSEPARTTARRGVVAALSAEHRDGDTLLMRADVGVSRSIAANGEVRYVSPRAQFHMFLARKPNDFPALGVSDLPGTHGELDWNQRATKRLSINAAGTFDQFNFAGFRETIGAASTGVRYSLTQHLSVLGGLDVSEIRTPAASTRTIGLPLGASYEGSRFGTAASYRLLDNSSASRRGDSLRLSGHAGAGQLTANAWVERQRQAPTLDLIFSAEPGLELALLRLGIAARNPEDVARALRDNPALVDLGFITGVNVQLTPRRVQAGFNLGWNGAGARGDHLRLQTVYSRDEGIANTSDSLIATLSYSRRILNATDLFGSYSLWRAGQVGRQERGTSLEVGFRQQLNGLPDFLKRSGSIGGFAYLDPEMRGVRGPGTQPLSGIAVTLDETRTIRTGATGAFAFDHVAPGVHRVVAQLPSSPRAFFTTTSRKEVTVPGQVDFGLVWAAARIDGRVISDAGAGVGSVVLSAAAPNGSLITATSDAEGRFVLAVPPGSYRVSLAAESLPAGYSPVGPVEQTVTIQADQPQSMSFDLQALRSVTGRASGASEVQIASLRRTARVDRDGNFVFRSMPSGTFELITRNGGRAVSASVTLPAEPAMVRDVVLGTTTPPPNAIAASATSIANRNGASSITPQAPVVSAGSGVRLFAGAFRLAGSAVAVQRRIIGLGGHAEIMRSGTLYLVTAGPFATREVAAAEAIRLRAAHIDVMTASDREPPTSIPRSTNGSHVVQAGAFRENQNAADLIGRLQRSGEHPFTTAARDLTLVFVGPFATRGDALAASERLRRAGFEGFVTRR